MESYVDNLPAKKFDHYYGFKNYPCRLKWFKQRCRIVAVGKLNSVLIEFMDGEKLTTSAHAVRPIKNGHYQERLF